MDRTLVGGTSVLITPNPETQVAGIVDEVVADSAIEVVEDSAIEVDVVVDVAGLVSVGAAGLVGVAGLASEVGDEGEGVDMVGMSVEDAVVEGALTRGLERRLVSRVKSSSLTERLSVRKK